MSGGTFSARAAAYLALSLLAAGCASAPVVEGQLIADPYEGTNRSVHSFNKGVDTALLRPITQAYDTVTPELIQHMVRNGLDHLSLPAIFINRVLQGDAEEAGAALARFSLNTIIGAGGLLDPATEFGLPHTPTDFGVTLARWGAPEGAFVEAPIFGPHTERHLVGRLVNFALDPAVLVTVGAVEVANTIVIIDATRGPLAAVRARDDNFGLIDDVLYESEDSYVTSRTGYVQARRRKVAGETTAEQAPNIFGD